MITKDLSWISGHSLTPILPRVNQLQSYTYSSSVVTGSTSLIPQPEYIQQVLQTEFSSCKPIYWEIAVLNYASLDARLKDVDVRILNLMVRGIRQKDKRMIVGNRRLAGHVGKKERTVSNSLNRIRKAGYLKCIRVGNGRNNASEDIVGEMFTPKKAFWCREQVTQKLRRQRVQINDTKGRKKLLPHPINHPINNTHIGTSFGTDGRELLNECISKAVGAVTSHSRPSFDEVFRFSESIGIPRDKAQLEYSRLYRSDWLTKDKTPIGDWKKYFNGYAKRLRRLL